MLALTKSSFSRFSKSMTGYTSTPCVEYLILDARRKELLVSLRKDTTWSKQNCQRIETTWSRGNEVSNFMQC